MSVLEGPGEGTWSVFAQKVVEERDALRSEAESLKAQLACANAFHDVAVKERDLYASQVTALRLELEEQRASNRSSKPPSQVPMAADEIRSVVMDANPDALVADDYASAFAGMAYRCGQPAVATYRVSKCLEVLMSRDGMSPEEATEFFEFNVAGAWCGEMTPMWLYDSDGDSVFDGSTESSEDPMPVPHSEATWALQDTLGLRNGKHSVDSTVGHAIEAIEKLRAERATLFGVVRGVLKAIGSGFEPTEKAPLSTLVGVPEDVRRACHRLAELAGESFSRGYEAGIWFMRTKGSDVVDE